MPLEREFYERLIRVEEKLSVLDAKVSDMRSLVRWIAVTVGGGVLAAGTNWILQGGLAAFASGGATP